jgi:hypothetical protein
MQTRSLLSESGGVIIPAAENGRKAEEAIMKTLVLALTLLLIPLTGSHAGPNAGLTLTPMGHVSGIGSSGDVCADISVQLPENCEDMDPNATPDANGVEWYIAVAAGDGLCFNTIVFGIGDYDPYACYLAAYGPCFPEFAPLEIPSSGWPGPNTGTAVSWAPNCLCGDLVPVYYFGFYVYYGGGPVPFGDFYPGNSATVVSCTSPPEEDPITDPNGDLMFGIIGCGDDDGYTECNGAPTVGACCIDEDGDGIDETCIPGTTEIQCFEVFGGSLWFPDTGCGPNNEPCPQPTPVEETTWGQIKSMYN